MHSSYEFKYKKSILYNTKNKFNDWNTDNMYYKTDLLNKLIFVSLYSFTQPRKDMV